MTVTPQVLLPEHRTEIQCVSHGYFVTPAKEGKCNEPLTPHPVRDNRYANATTPFPNKNRYKMFAKNQDAPLS